MSIEGDEIRKAYETLDKRMKAVREVENAMKQAYEVALQNLSDDCKKYVIEFEKFKNKNKLG